MIFLEKLIFGNSDVNFMGRQKFKMSLERILFSLYIFFSANYQRDLKPIFILISVESSYWLKHHFTQGKFLFFFYFGFSVCFLFSVGLEGNISILYSCIVSKINLSYSNELFSIKFIEYFNQNQQKKVYLSPFFKSLLLLIRICYGCVGKEEPCYLHFRG